MQPQSQEEENEHWDAYKSVETSVVAFLRRFYADPHSPRGLYLRGPSGCGKSTFLLQLLKRLQCQPLMCYTSQDVWEFSRNDRNILGSFFRAASSSASSSADEVSLSYRSVLVCDGLEKWLGSTESGIQTLVTLIRPKTNKKMRTEERTYKPIVCVGEGALDKKTMDLIKVCEVIDIPPISAAEFAEALRRLTRGQLTPEHQAVVLQYMDGQLRRWNLVRLLWLQQPELLQVTDSSSSVLLWLLASAHTTSIKHAPNAPNASNIQDVEEEDPVDDDAEDNHNACLAHGRLKNIKHCVSRLLASSEASLEDSMVSEHERATIAMVWHENVADVLDQQLSRQERIALYHRMTQFFCLGEDCELHAFCRPSGELFDVAMKLKTEVTHRMLHDTTRQQRIRVRQQRPEDIRYTKLISKTAAEHNTQQFLRHICYELKWDKFDLMLYCKWLQLSSSSSSSSFSSSSPLSGLSKLEHTRLMRLVPFY